MNPLPTIPTALSETIRLEQILSSPVVGISCLDSQGILVHYFDFDPQLREAIVEYYQERIRQLIRSEQAAEEAGRLLGQPQPYAVNED